ncbi:MAG TPA: ester cyclase [Thermomicrobiales bacterium]|nr:ester cyclase [Thermomicrobiales bacterium]
MQKLVAPVRWFLNTRLARSLRFRLIVIVLLASLPALLLLLLTASQQRDAALATGQEEAVRLARTAASDQGRQMDRVQRELSLLARLPEVRGDNANACTQFFLGLVADPENANYVDLRVLERDGDVFCRSSGANPLAGDVAQTFIQDAFAGTPFTVGPYRTNPLTSRTIISFAAPVRADSGTIDRVIVVTLDLSSQSTFLTNATLPEGGVIQLVSEDGTLLLQRPPDEEAVIGASLVGTPAIDAIVGAATPVAGEAQVVDHDAYVRAIEPVTITGTKSVAENASVIVQLPKGEIVRRANDAFRDNLGKLGVATAVVIFAAWISADLFTSRDAESRKSIVAELYHAYTSGSVGHLDTIVAPDFVDHSPAPGQAKGVDGLKQNVAAFRTAFPDGEIVPRELLADRDKVVARVSLTGTHIGEFHGVSPSDKRMVADGIETFQFRNGVIAEGWSLFGPLVEMQKLTEVERRPEEPVRKRSIWQRILRRGKTPEPES